MALQSGTKLGRYEVVAPIGRGGMGEVYRARDTRLGRDVALKVLPEAVSRDAERMGRFEREAQLLASLNHPHIAALYGLEESGGAPALATRAGVVLGTAAFMSPEQARGKMVDRRADIWAFGCVRFEMLAGKQAFEGETVSDTLAGVLKTEPDWDAIPAGTPPRIENLLRRCLEKDHKRRLQAIGEARIAIEETLAGAADVGATLGSPWAGQAPPLRQPWRRALPWVIAASAALAFAFVAAHDMLQPKTGLGCNLPQPSGEIAMSCPRTAAVCDDCPCRRGKAFADYRRRQLAGAPQKVSAGDCSVGVSIRRLTDE